MENNMDSQLQAFATGVGYLALIRASMNLVQFLRLNVLSTPQLAKYKPKQTSVEQGGGQRNPWALVTGASEGIGKAFADALASHGFNVIMVALDDQVLHGSVEELRTKWGSKKKKVVQIEGIGFDFSSGIEAYESSLFPKIEQILRGTDGGAPSSFISMLVNNVGINYPFPRPFDSVSSKKEAAILRVNCESTLHMTKFVLPAMKAHDCGGIVTMSSITATIPAGLLSSYAATKLFNAHFSKCLGAELQHEGKKGIDCIAVAPNFIATKMSRQKAGGLVNTPAELANAALSQIGKTDFTAGGLRQNLIMSVYHSIPKALQNRVIVGANAAVMKKGFASVEAKRKKQQQGKSKL